MTNPLPIEAALLARCSDHTKVLCVFGQRQPTPRLVVQLIDNLDLAQGSAAILQAVSEVNATIPTYSQVQSRHVLVVQPPADEPLPTSEIGRASCRERV